jgi:hypothetical protein
MNRRHGLLICVLFLSACDPYERRGGQYDVEPADPVNFPAFYLGTGGDPKKGGGVFTANVAFVDGVSVDYYAFPFTSAQLKADDPLAIGDGFTTPSAYVFDPPDRAMTLKVAGPACVAPKDYVYDQQRDAIHYDDQGPIFTALPTGTKYVPVVAEVPVKSNGEDCQSLRSSDAVVTSTQVQVPLKPPAVVTPTSKPTGIPDGKYLAWAIIDPGAEVRHGDAMPETSSNPGPQRIGWYNSYFVQFLDGGYIPTAASADGASTDLVTQVLYVPSAIPVTDDQGATTNMSTGGKPGSGHDVLDARRGDAAYSPVCHVMVFTAIPGWPLPTRAADIPMATLVEAPTPYIYCLQTN